MIYLYGASGHAKVIVDILISTNKVVEGVFDDNDSLESFLDLLFMGVFNNSKIKKDSKLIISIGNNSIRKSIVERSNFKYLSAIHRNSVISPSAKVDEGTVIMSNAVINSNSVIGKHCIINTSSVVEHDCEIDDFVHVSPNATLTGRVRVGEGSHIGAGAVILPNVSIGKWCKIGAGSVVLKNVPDNSIVVGNPGKIIKKI